MDDAHIAFISLPHSPHVFPTLPIVSSLVRRGYRVTYATSERFASSVESVGARLISCPLFSFGDVSDEGSHETRRHEEPLLDFTQRMIDAISPFYEADRPSLILYDFMAFSGRILAQRLGIPAIQTSPFYAFEGNDFAGQVKHEKFRKMLIEDGEVVARWLKRYGVESRNYRIDKEKLNIYLFPRFLQPNSSLFGDNCFFAGRCAAERIAAGSWQDHSGGRPIALVAMSTIHAVSTTGTDIPDHFRMCVDALSGHGWHIVLSIGERTNSSSLFPLPPHCETIPHTSYLRVLSKAKLLFFMSGIVSTSEAAYHGIPMVAISNGVEEFEWQADHIAELGIGAHIRRAEMNTEHLRQVALRISSDPHVLTRVKNAQYQVRREPGAEETANRIEDYLDAKRS